MRPMLVYRGHCKRAFKKALSFQPLNLAKNEAKSGENPVEILIPLTKIKLANAQCMAVKWDHKLTCHHTNQMLPKVNK